MWVTVVKWFVSRIPMWVDLVLCLVSGNPMGYEVYLVSGTPMRVNVV